MLPMDMPDCHVVGVEPVEKYLLVLVAGNAVIQACPDCGHVSDDVHSTYGRTPRDLPVQGRCVRVQMIVRRWRCLNRACSRETFCESFDGFVRRHAQRTERMTRVMERLIMVVSSNTGAYLGQVIRLNLSARPLLRTVDHGAVQARTPRVLGIDDFALRKAQTYGTLLCDLETREPIDVVLGRTKQPVVEWFKNRSGIEIVARDRATSYADAIRTGAPEAIQVADRFHLVKNLRDALKEVVDRQSWALPEPALLPVSVSGPESAPEPEPIPVSQPAKRMTRAERQKAIAAERLQHRYEEVRRLRNSGMSIRQIRKATGLSCPTIYKYIHLDEVPTHAERRGRPSQLDPFVPYLSERWHAGYHNAGTLYKEIVQQGYKGSKPSLRRLLHPWRKACPPPPKARPRSPREENNRAHKRTWKEMRQAVLCLPERLSDADRPLLQDFLALHPKLDLARNLVDQFRCLLRDHDTAAFDTWLTAAAQSELAPFERLARTLNADRVAVLAGIELPWSTGQVEGQITRVKLIKRIGYGRASLPLLRARILDSAQRAFRSQKRTAS